MQNMRSKICLFLFFSLFVSTTGSFGMIKKGTRHPSQEEGLEGLRISSSYRPQEEPTLSHSEQREPSPLITMPTLYDPERDMYYSEKLTEEHLSSALFSRGELTPQQKVELLEQATMHLEMQFQEQQVSLAEAASDQVVQAYMLNIEKLKKTLQEARAKLSEEKRIIEGQG